MSTLGIATEARQPMQAAESEPQEITERHQDLSIIAASVAVFAEYQDPFNDLSGDEQIPFGD